MSMELNKALELLREIRPSIPKEVLELWCKDRDAFLASHPAVEQAGGDERAAFEAWMTWLMDHVYGRLPDFTLDDGSGAHYVNADVSYAWTAWQARAALAQPSPVPELERPATFSVPSCENSYGFGYVDGTCIQSLRGYRDHLETIVDALPEGELMTVAQHDRIVGELRAEIAMLRSYEAEWELLLNDHEQQRDAALARVAELEAKLSDPTAVHQWQFSNAWFDGSEEVVLKAGKEGSPIRTLYTAPAQAQHSAGYAEARQCVNCRHIGINDAADYAVCHDCRWTGPEPDEDKCPGCAGENCMAAACPECGGRYELVAEANIATPVAQAQHSVPDGWVQSLPLKDHQPCKSNEDRANGYVIPIYSRPVPVEEALRKLRAVLCDPVGNVVIDGSDGDREEVQRALGILAAAPGKEVGHE